MTDSLLRVCRAVGLCLRGKKTAGSNKGEKKGEIEKKRKEEGKGRISCLVKAGDVAQ